MESQIKPLPGGLLLMISLLIVLISTNLVAQVENLPAIPLDSIVPTPDNNFSLPRSLPDLPGLNRLEKYPMRIFKPEEGKKFACRYFNTDESKKYPMQIINPDGKDESAKSYGFFKKYYNAPQIPDSILVIPEPEQLFKKFREKK